jgi:hypothetical protein
MVPHTIVEKIQRDNVYIISGYKEYIEQFEHT